MNLVKDSFDFIGSKLLALFFQPFAVTMDAVKVAAISEFKEAVKRKRRSSFVHLSIKMI